MTIKTFRGKVAHGDQDTIVLHTNDGSTGYKIVKFELIGEKPATTSQESVVKIYSTSQSTIDENIEFDENTLLAAGFYENNSASTSYGGVIVIFDNMTFNQDIYVSHFEGGGTQPVNYYIELEQMKLDLNENTVATLKDIRNTTAPITS